MLYVTSPTLTAVSLSLVPLVGILAMGMSKYSSSAQRKLTDLQSKMMTFCIERFGKISTVRLNGREKFEKKKFSEFMEEQNKIAKQAYSARGAFLSFIGLTTNISLIAVLLVGGNLISKGKMTAGSLTRFAIQSAFVGLGFSGLSTFYSDLNKSLDAADRIFSTLDSGKPSKYNSAKGTKNVSTHNSTVNEAMGTIQIKNVCFSYKSRPEVMVLKDFSLTIKKNCITSIVGKSGSGKSTILGLLCGLYKATSGNILIDGRDIDIVDHIELIQKTVGVVEQKAGLLSGTIGENIGYGREGCTQQEIEQAAKDADAHEFIMEKGG
jgi:ABC-type multidrug transport system fused ATPase/permease subunit